METALNDIAQLREAIQALEEDKAKKSEIEDLKKENACLAEKVTEMMKGMEDLKFQIRRANTRATVLADKTKTLFQLEWKNPSPLIKEIAVRLEKYELKESYGLGPCDYMDLDSGVYTTPVEGEYRFIVQKLLDSTDLYLCREDGQRDLIEVKWDDYEEKYNGKVELTLENNVKVWLEALSKEADAKEMISFTGYEKEAYVILTKRWY